MKNKKETIHVMSSYEATIRNKEHFNPFMTGHGVHKTEKRPSRARRKELDRRELELWKQPNILIQNGNF